VKWAEEGAMIRMEKKTRLRPEEIIGRAVNFFGENGEQLAERDRGRCCIYFEGGGGYVAVSVVEEKKIRTIDVETREFEYQVKRFLETL